MTIARPDRLRLAELTSDISAVVPGVGLGVLAADRRGRFGLPLLPVGLVVHAWGRFDKHRQERKANAPDVWRERLAYWVCWGLLAILVASVIGRPAGAV